MSAAGNQPFKLIVEETACRHCRRCLAGDICRGNAFIRFERDESPFIDMSRCWGCLVCLPACPFEAIQRAGYSEAASV